MRARLFFLQTIWKGCREVVRNPIFDLLMFLANHVEEVSGGAVLSGGVVNGLVDEGGSAARWWETVALSQKPQTTVLPGARTAKPGETRA